MPLSISRSKTQYSFSFYCFLLPSFRGNLHMKYSQAFHFKDIIVFCVWKTSPFSVESTHSFKLNIICFYGRIINIDIVIIAIRQWFFKQFLRASIVDFEK